VDDADEPLLVRQAQAGDRASFAVLVERYWERIRRWLYGYTGNAHLAEDLTQETFVRAWSAVRSLHGLTGFRPWLFRIARHLAIDARKGPRGKATRELPVTLASDAPEPVTVLLETEALRKLREACDRLPSLNRQAYLLWAQEGLPYSEIAAILDSTEEMARWRVCKARQALVKDLKDYLGQS